MHRSILQPVSAVIAIAIATSAIAACGAKSQASPPNKQQKMKPIPGHVINNPTAAQSYIYLPMTVEQESNGDLLILDAGNWDESNSKIVEMTPSGTVDWEYVGGMAFPHSAYPVSKNDILISDTNNDRVFEINRQGKTIWTTDSLGGGKGFLGHGRFSDGGQLLYPNDAVMMPHNQILISSRFNNTVWEINKAGKVTWKCDRFMFRQHHARLVNGNLYVADSDNGRVLVINHACNKILFQYGGGFSPTVIWPRSFTPYPGGNYIISDSQHSRILEINKQKKVVQQWPNLPSPYYVEVMKNGDLLTENSAIHGAVILGPSGNIVKEYATHDPAKLPTTTQNGGFESGASGWLKGDMLAESLPAGQVANMGIDTSQAHSGKASAFINWPANKPHLYLFWQQTMKVTPGHSYNFSGWIKTQNVKACNGCDHGKYTEPQNYASYYVQYVEPNNPHTAPLGIQPGTATGTSGWQHETYPFTVPSGVTEVNLQAILYGRGKVWFDDVSLKPLQ